MAGATAAACVYMFSVRRAVPAAVGEVPGR
jgi:hypothetical protein